MTINEIIAYVLHTPYNVNPAILKGMLERLVEGGGGSDTAVVGTAVVGTSKAG